MLYLRNFTEIHRSPDHRTLHVCLRWLALCFALLQNTLVRHRDGSVHATHVDIVLNEACAQVGYRRCTKIDKNIHELAGNI